MEDGLGEYPELEYNVSDVCLNPCFNGRWTRRFAGIIIGLFTKVLILVLMEDGLGDCFMEAVVSQKQCLNPCFNGRWTRRGVFIIFSVIIS